MTTKQQQARHMYMHESCTQRHIAKQLGVSERTIYSWIYDNSWDKLRMAAYAAPAIMSQNLCNQLVELQNTIATREPGQRFPTLQEAVITGKLINGIEKLKRYPSLSQNIQVLETFKRYVSPLATKEFNTRLNMFSELYADVEAKNGFRPYEIEYGIDCTPLPCSEPGEEPAVPNDSNDSTYVEQPEEVGNAPELATQQSAATNTGTSISEAAGTPATRTQRGEAGTPTPVSTFGQELQRLRTLVETGTNVRSEISPNNTQ